MKRIFLLVWSAGFECLVKGFFIVHFLKKLHGDKFRWCGDRKTWATATLVYTFLMIWFVSCLLRWFILISIYFLLFVCLIIYVLVRTPDFSIKYYSYRFWFLNFNVSLTLMKYKCRYHNIYVVKSGIPGWLLLMPWELLQRMSNIHLWLNFLAVLRWRC